MSESAFIQFSKEQHDLIQIQIHSNNLTCNKFSQNKNNQIYFRFFLKGETCETSDRLPTMESPWVAQLTQ